jgi:CheY-like chemotaxis protein
MKALEIFLVEDNPGDVVLTREALAGYPVPVELVVAHDGEEALAMLSAPNFKPNVIILDLNMARIDGHTVLERYRQEDVPTVIFSSTQNGAEVQRALALGAREFVKKPLSFQSYAEAVRGILDRWARKCRPPSGILASGL